MTVGLLFFGILLLIGMASVLSASETAFVAASKATVQAMAKAGHKRAIALKALQKNMEKVIGTILLCNNMVNIIASAIASQFFTELFGDAGLAYATAFMTVLIVVYAEIVPKFFAINNPVRIALFFTPLIRLISVLLHPIVTMLEWMARKSLALFGVSSSKSAQLTHSTDELRGAIDLHQSSVVPGDARAMLHSILDLAHVDVHEIMIHRQKVVMLNAKDPIKDIIEAVLNSPYSRIPLFENDPDNIVGVLHVKTFLRGVLHENLDAVDLLSLVHKPWFIPKTTSLGKQLQAFKTRQEHFAIVVDEYGAFMGIVTLEDIVEEIVGDIFDESDLNLSGVWTLKNGDIFTVGTTTLRDLNRQFHWNLPDDNASTIAGLLLHESHTVPQLGQRFSIENLTLEVMRRHQNQITLIRITHHDTPQTKSH